MIIPFKNMALKVPDLMEHPPNLIWEDNPKKIPFLRYLEEQGGGNSTVEGGETGWEDIWDIWEDF